MADVTDEEVEAKRASVDELRSQVYEARQKAAIDGASGINEHRMSRLDREEEMLKAELARAESGSGPSAADAPEPPDDSAPEGPSKKED